MKTVLYVWSACALAAQQYTISTYAGGAPPLTPVAAVKTSIFPNPGFSTDGQNIYFVSSNCIFKVDLTGVMTRVAGNSRWGASADGVPAVNAEFSVLGSVLVDHAGTVYFVD